ncbi:TetR/AcrR family transcriptional regulator C-terminal domain-containing protein [Actinoallomurus bryophytorum]|uniref:TetR family transcriptional regulator n=1 Tax=Actinoallomurus bryophytorum TaxID=1490222 RepID=A0A543CU02_9ACTN|nr:TetR/AcrR family transcriptional regulator [Actinoallomurus bryophytorum]TQM00511.1 TetR family transcriptional regulator [Actinoallomurus bryophytorum]
MNADESGTTPRSRRERPAKPALTRQGIIDAALAILREEGLSKVTMRRIAATLDTGPSSLYVYVSNTEDLHAQILDVLLGTVTVSARGAGPWRDRLKALLNAYRDVLFEHPEIARMALSTQPSGPNYMALAEAILALLAEGGVTGRAAAWGLDLLLLVPTAAAVEHTGPRSAAQEAADLSALADQIRATDPARYPHITALGDELVSGDGASRSDWAFNVLVDGVLASLPRT